MPNGTGGISTGRSSDLFVGSGAPAPAVIPGVTANVALPAQSQIFGDEARGAAPAGPAAPTTGGASGGDVLKLLLLGLLGASDIGTNLGALRRGQPPQATGLATLLEFQSRQQEQQELIAARKMQAQTARLNTLASVTNQYFDAIHKHYEAGGSPEDAEKIAALYSKLFQTLGVAEGDKTVLAAAARNDPTGEFLRDSAPWISQGEWPLIRRAITKSSEPIKVQQVLFEGEVGTRIAMDLRRYTTLAEAAGKPTFETILRMVRAEDQADPNRPAQFNGVLRFLRGAVNVNETGKAWKADVAARGWKIPEDEAELRKLETKIKTEKRAEAEAARETLPLRAPTLEAEAAARTRGEETAAGEFPSQAIRDEITAEKNPEVKAALERVEARLLKRSQEQGVAAAKTAEEIRLGRGVPAEELSELVSAKALREKGEIIRPKTLTVGARETTKDLVRMPVKTQEAWGVLQKSQALIGNLETLGKRVFTANTGSEAIRQAADLTVKQVKRDPAVVAYFDSREAFLGNLSRTAGAEVGVLTDQDIARVKKATGGKFDTVDIAALKHGFLRDLLDTEQRAIINRVTGEPVEKLRSRVEQLLEKLEIPGTRAATQQEFDDARRQAKGDQALASEILRGQGINTRLNIRK